MLAKVENFYIGAVRIFSFVLATLLLIATVCVVVSGYHGANHMPFKPQTFDVAQIPANVNFQDGNWPNEEEVNQYQVSELGKWFFEKYADGQDKESTEVAYKLSSYAIDHNLAPSDLTAWKAYHSTVVEPAVKDKKYKVISILMSSMQQFNELKKLHDQDEHDAYFDRSVLAIALGCFGAFISVTLLLILAKIESNTRAGSPA